MNRLLKLSPLFVLTLFCCFLPLEAQYPWAQVGPSNSKPGSCIPGQQFSATDLAAGSNIFVCTTIGGTATQWTQVGTGTGIPILTAAPGTCVPNVSPAVVFVSLNGSSGALYYCSAVNTWTLVPTGAGTVTVVGGGNLGSSAIVTGGGSQTAQTPNTSATMDSGGNISTPGGVTSGASSGKTGYYEYLGATSGGQGFTVLDVAGTAYLYVLPNAPGGAGKFLQDNGSTACPTLAAGAPGNCEGLAWNVLPVAYRYQACNIVIGDTSSSTTISNSQLGPQSRICFIPAAATIVELDVNADTGTPNVIVGRNHAGTVANIVSSALATAASGGIACSNTGGTTGLNGATTCSATLQNTSLAAGDYLELVSGTAGGTAKLMVIHITYSVN